LIRTATPADIGTLLAIERTCFAGNRLTRRRFNYLLETANSALLVDVANGEPRGYVLLLFRDCASVARLYSIAVHPRHMGQGIATGLAAAAEQIATGHGATRLRLEIRRDNQPSQTLFRQRGYDVFGSHVAYYHDGMDALRLEKTLVADHCNTPLTKVTPSDSARSLPRAVSRSP
jgi:ribosomal protein S18 acetylase RimI-like enzyme